MTGIAVLIMLLAIVIIWGGLAVSITALISRGRREDRAGRRVARARGAAGERGRSGRRRAAALSWGVTRCGSSVSGGSSSASARTWRLRRSRRWRSRGFRPG